ncbi:extracellular solute-binding protein [Jiangella endophytica]|uniref:extracellular solute-binding protein n=1 Tax=Jiangella endophytica TaxID=1623398 RepID=UPI001300A8BB|nr:extracellular solute-binding protein [Jiangella endophytica]
MSPLDRRQFLRGAAGVAGLFSFPALLSACGGSGSPASSGGGGSAVALPTYVPFDGVTPDLAGEAGRSDPVYFRYPANPARLHDAVPGDGAPFSALVIADQAPPALADNAYWQALDERLGSPYEPVFSPAADYANKFATVTAGDDLPDFYLILPTAPAIPQLLAAKATDLSEQLSGDAVEAYPGLANLPTESWRGTVFDGRIMALPITRGFSTSWIMYKRLDVLEPLGLGHDPTSYDEFVAMLTEANDPASSRWSLASLPTDFIRQMLGIPNQWSEDAGEFTSAYEHEAQEEALEGARRIWEADLINPDAPATHDSQQREWLLSGTSLFVWNTLSGWATVAGGGGQVDGYVGSAMVPSGFDSGTGTPYLGNPNHSIVAINKASGDRVETLLKIADWLATPFGTEEWLFRQYGILGEHYTMGADGLPVTDADRAPEKGLGQGYVSAPPNVSMSADKDLITRRHEFEHTWTENAIPNPALSLYSETQSRQGAALETAIKAVEADIVLGRAPVSSWRDAVADYLSGGGDAIKRELAQSYQASNG